MTYWKTLFSTLHMIRYNGTVSIEYKDSLISRSEGLKKAVSMMKECITMKGGTAM